METGTNDCQFDALSTHASVCNLQLETCWHILCSGKDIYISRAAWWHKTSSSSSAWARTGSLRAAHTILLAASTAEGGGAAVTACQHMPNFLAVMCYQAWRIAHPPVRGQAWLGRRPLVHVGFLKSWLAGGLKLKVVNKVLEAVQLCKQQSKSDRPVTVLVTGEAMNPFPLPPPPSHEPMNPCPAPTPSISTSPAGEYLP